MAARQPHEVTSASRQIGDGRGPGTGRVEARADGGSGPMTIRVSDRPCPECGAELRVIYVSRLEQVVSGWSCANCGFVESEKQGYRANVPLIEDEAYLIRKLQPLSTADVRDPLGDVEGEFRARAATDMDADEVWMLVDPESEELVDVVYGSEHAPGDEDRDGE